MIAYEMFIEHPKLDSADAYLGSHLLREPILKGDYFSMHMADDRVCRWEVISRHFDGGGDVHCYLWPANSAATALVAERLDQAHKRQLEAASEVFDGS